MILIAGMDSIRLAWCTASDINGHVALPVILMWHYSTYTSDILYQRMYGSDIDVALPCSDIDVAQPSANVYM